MRIFEHRIFSKSFGGKICHNWTDVTYRMNKQCVSFLAGKLKMFKLPITRVESTEKTFQIVHEITFAYVWLQVCDFGKIILDSIWYNLDSIPFVGMVTLIKSFLVQSSVSFAIELSVIFPRSLQKNEKNPIFKRT